MDRTGEFSHSVALFKFCYQAYALALALQAVITRILSTVAISRSVIVYSDINFRPFV